MVVLIGIGVVCLLGGYLAGFHNGAWYADVVRQECRKAMTARDALSDPLRLERVEPGTNAFRPVPEHAHRDYTAAEFVAAAKRHNARAKGRLN